ncbi:hypothetical protein K491DRAFT_602720, partial [Lophiostoma macrostomum CBS 122681]
ISILAILFSFSRWTGKYFYCLVVATVGVFIFELGIFFLVFKPEYSPYGVTVCINSGWTAMVTGQSLVLWSRLNLVCRSQWKLKAILYMIIADGVLIHVIQTVFSFLNGRMDPTYKPFEVMEKVSIVMFTVQEIIISSVYLFETVRILRVGELVHKKSNRRRVQLLFLANIAIIAIDVTTITLEFVGLWGVWCSFKGFGYSVKLKIEFAILNQLRDSVKSTTSGGYGPDSHSNGAIGLSSRSRNDKKTRGSTKPTVSALERQTFEELDDQEHITKTVEITIQQSRVNSFNRAGGRSGAQKDVRVDVHPPSESSSEIDFASKGG